MKFASGSEKMGPTFICKMWFHNYLQMTHLENCFGEILSNVLLEKKKPFIFLQHKIHLLVEFQQQKDIFMNLEARVVKLLPKRKDCRTKRPYLNGLPPQFGSTFFLMNMVSLPMCLYLVGEGLST